MIAAGLLDTSADHALAVTEFAFSMREEASRVLDPTTFLPLQVCVGVCVHMCGMLIVFMEFGPFPCVVPL